MALKYYIKILKFWQNPDDSDLEYRLIAGNLPHGITLDENGGYLNGEVPDIERLYSFTIRAINNQTKYADSVFKMEVIGKHCTINFPYYQIDKMEETMA